MYRIGFGYDVHRLEAGHTLRLGGIAIPYDQGLVGYSDADVLLHAITDALLGATGLGDIGTHFPSTDPQYKDVDSRVLLRIAMDQVSSGGWMIANIDTTVVMEQPRLAPHVQLDALEHCGVLGLREDQVSVKGKTTDGLGFTGAGEGIAAYAVVLLRANSEPAAPPPRSVRALIQRVAPPRSPSTAGLSARSAPACSFCSAPAPATARRTPSTCEQGGAPAYL